MNCEDFGRYLDNYENLTASEKSQMLEHSDMCEKCRAELDFFLSMIATTNSLPKIEPPADFMDKLGERLDAEDKRVVSASKIMYHIRRNWKQYTAAAACLALVTVITANRSMLLDRYVENNDDGVISEETVPADGTPAPESSAVTPDETNAPTASSAPQPNAAAPTAQPAPAQTAQSPSKAAAATAPATRRQSSAQQTPAKPAATVIASVPEAAGASEEVQQQPEPAKPAAQNQPASTEAASPAKTEAKSESAAKASKPQDDYGIARVTDSTASVSYDLRAEDVKASLDASEVKANYSLAEGGEEIAYGRYYTLDRNGNPISSASGIGSIKISSEDAELAMEIIDRYPHDESGNVYTTDSVNLTRILSKLKSEGVSFTDYTLGDTGEVKFKVIFN